jgi:beta-glucosidase
VLPCVGTIAGIERLNFSGLCYADGPSGYSRSDGVSVFPSGITVAATWDSELMFERALALGKSSGIKVLMCIWGTANLAPSTCPSRTDLCFSPSAGPMGRSTRGGRVWEGFGPDPYLAGVAMNSTVVGIQAAGVQAASKHYIANEQETQRGSTSLAGGLTVTNGTVIDAVSSNVDDRTLHELYIWPFVSANRKPRHLLFSRMAFDTTC